jgi:hypothetical protein
MACHSYIGADARGEEGVGLVVQLKVQIPQTEPRTEGGGVCRLIDAEVCEVPEVSDINNDGPQSRRYRLQSTL